MTLLDVSIVNVALPSMEHGVGATPVDVSWVVSGYALTFGLALVPAGRLGDDHGRKRMFLLGLLLFVVTSGLCGAAQSASWLVIARLCQGIAGGLLNPQVIGVIQQLFQGRERGRAFGMFGAVVGLSTAVGPLLGGLLIQAFGENDGWRYVFYVNLPIGIVALLFGARLLPAYGGGQRRGVPDLLGTVLLGLAVVTVMLPLVEDENPGANPHWWLTGVGAVLLIAFVFWERRLGRLGRAPLVKLELLGVRSYAMGATLGMVYFAGFTGIFLVATLFFQQGLGYTALESGAANLAFAVGSAISPTIGGRYVHRFGRRMIVLGIAAVLVGLGATAILIWRWTGTDIAFVLAGPLFVAGFGSGLVISPNQTLALEDIPPAEGGTAAGVLQTGQRIGSAVGTALGGFLFFGQLSRSHGDYHQSAALGFAGATGLVAVTLLIGLTDVILSRRRRRKPPGPSLVGTVTGVASAVVTLTSLDGRQVARTSTGEAGRFALTAAHGRYLLLVTAPDVRPDVREIALTDGPVTADVQLAGSGGLVGMVASDRGPVGEARVTLTDRDGNVRHIGVTDAEGRYRIDGIAPDDYTIVVSGYAPAASTVRITPGAQIQHTALLRALR